MCIVESYRHMIPNKHYEKIVKNFRQNAMNTLRESAINIALFTEKLDGMSHKMMLEGLIRRHVKGTTIFQR